jgi:hypothetical protein
VPALDPLIIEELKDAPRTDDRKQINKSKVMSVGSHGNPLCLPHTDRSTRRQQQQQQINNNNNNNNNKGKAVPVLN